jgi:hypothetical protein
MHPRINSRRPTRRSCEIDGALYLIDLFLMQGEIMPAHALDQVSAA